MLNSQAFYCHNHRQQSLIRQHIQRMHLLRLLSSLSSNSEPVAATNATSTGASSHRRALDERAPRSVQQLFEVIGSLCARNGLGGCSSLFVRDGAEKVLYRVYMVSRERTRYRNVLYIDDVLTGQTYFAYKRPRAMRTGTPDVVVTPLHDFIYTKPRDGDVIVRTKLFGARGDVLRYREVAPRTPDHLAAFEYSKTDRIFNSIQVCTQSNRADVPDSTDCDASVSGEPINEGWAFLLAYVRHIVLAMDYPERVLPFYHYWQCDVPTCRLDIDAVVRGDSRMVERIVY